MPDTPTRDVADANAAADPTFDRGRLLAEIGALTMYQGAAAQRIAALQAQITELQAANAQLRERLDEHASTARERDLAQ